MFSEPLFWQRSPNRPLVYRNVPEKLCTKEDAMEAAIVSLSSWNEKSIANKGLEYELVEVLEGNLMVGGWVTHCNFIARPKYDTEAEHKLFFGEVMTRGSTNVAECTECCILGPVGTETGIVECRTCVGHPDHLVHHPEHGDFMKGWSAFATKSHEKYLADQKVTKLTSDLRALS